MAIRSVITLAIAAMLTTSAFAREGVPTKHKHDGREHEHPLPAEGLNHNHKQVQTKEWIYIHSTAGAQHTWYAKNGSLVVNNGKRTILGKHVDRPLKKEHLHKYSVLDSDCRKETGFIVSVLVEGNYASTGKFIFGQTSVPNSVIAEYICKTAR